MRLPVSFRLAIAVGARARYILTGQVRVRTEGILVQAIGCEYIYYVRLHYYARLSFVATRAGAFFFWLGYR